MLEDTVVLKSAVSATTTAIGDVTLIIPALFTEALTAASEKVNFGNITLVGLLATNVELSIIIVFIVLSFKLCSNIPSDLSPVK